MTKTKDSLIKSFCGGPGGSFFKKRPLAAGTSMLDFGGILERLVNSGRSFINNCFLGFFAVIITQYIPVKSSLIWNIQVTFSSRLDDTLSKLRPARGISN
jgi:hypothetical protein